METVVSQCPAYGQGIQTRGSRPIPRQSNTKKVLTLQPGHRLALTLEVLEKEPTVAGGPSVNASVQLVTKRGEKITIRIRYESVLGGLSFSPASLRFEASFPGRVQNRVVAARSTFEQPLQLSAVRSTDSRIIPELLTKTLKPLARTEVVRVYYDPAKASGRFFAWQFVGMATLKHASVCIAWFRFNRQGWACQSTARAVACSSFDEALLADGADGALRRSHLLGALVRRDSVLTLSAKDWQIQFENEEDFRSGLEALEAAARRGRALSRTAALPETLAVLLVWKSSATFSTAHNYAKACLNNGAPWRLRAGATAPVVTVPNVTVPTVTAPAMAPLLQKGFALVQGFGKVFVAVEGNVLVFCQEKWRAKLADFGNAQVYMTLPALTLNYRSPEVILGKRPGPPSDMWSLGVLLYEMMWLLGGNDVLRQLLQPDFALRPTARDLMPAEMSEPDANAAVELGWKQPRGSVALCVCLRFAAKALPILIARKSLSLVPADTVCKGKLWQWDLDRQDEAQHQMRTDATWSSALAADCEGGRAFHLGPEAEGQIWHVEPYGEASIGPVIFEPFQHAQFRTTLYVRNNLTTLHPVELNGHGGSSRLVFPEGVLEFNLTISDFAEEEDGSGAVEDSEKGSHGSMLFKRSKPWWRQRRLAVTRSIVATNDCELPVEVAQIDIGGIPGCSAFGFEVQDCQLPITVAPRESVAFMVSFTPEVVASRWVQPKQQKTLKIMRRAWVSHELVSEVASILLENVLMYDVEWHRPKASPLDDFRALSLGEADVNFEVWQGGKAEELQRWVRSDSAEVVGSHSMLAYDGIHTLKHTIDRFPEAEFYQYLQTPQMSWVFASDAFQQGESFADPGNLCRDQRWNCTDFVWQPPHCREEVRCVGQVLHDYPHYSQGVMEQQIANNGLPLSTVYLTPLSKQVAVWNAFASKRNILFQHHFPSEGVDGVPSSAFVPIQFSPKRYGCNSTESSSPDGGFSCHLEAKRLLIVASPAFVTEGDAAYFAERFRLDKESYDRLFDLWRQHDGDAYQAACRWLQETGSSKWGGWIRFSKQVDFIREFPPMSGCFPTFYLFFLAAVTVAFTEKYLLKSLKACKRWCTRPPAQNPNWEPTDLSDIQRRMNDRASYTTPDFTSKLVASRSASFVEVKMALLKGSMGFMSFFRDEEDFCEDSGRAMIPPQASSCFRQYFHSSLQVLIYIVTSGLANIAVSALTFALATGMVGALLAEVRATKENNKQVDPLLQVEDWYTNWLSDMQTVTVLIDDFKFLPTFFITYMIGQDVTRWLEWLRTMFRVQGRLHDVGLVVATSYRKVNDPQIGKQQRQMLFKWYRYLNAIHYLGYFKLAPSIGASGDEVLQDLRTAGLLKEAECQQLQFAGTKLRDTLVSWLGTLWHDELERGWVQSSDSDVFMRKICELRGILAQLSDMQDLRISQMVRVMMVVVTNILLGLALIGYPTKMYEDTTECIQFWPLIACYLYFICYRGMLHVMFLLDKGPFYAKGDCVNIDALLISTERYMFHIFRTSFKSSQQKNTKYPLPDRPQEPAAV
ncbi:unnamed protein product [Durusdinium trenchii]|uniref:Protein kinase domain-containing protein n=1 Tax=Durusdinium trenchii TaxID=1381693 RepID=A0ABP0PNQ2_9DINO